MSKTFTGKIDKNFDVRCQFFLDFFGFIAFSGVSQRWEFRNTRKNLKKKNLRGTNQPRQGPSFFLGPLNLRTWAAPSAERGAKKNPEEPNTHVHVQSPSKKQKAPTHLGFFSPTWFLFAV
jgi:hypothetical protein